MDYQAPRIEFHQSVEVVQPLSAVHQCVANIFEIKSLTDVNADQPEKTFFLFDIDDTVFDSLYMVGSSQWRKYIKEATTKIDNSKNWHDIFSYFLAQNHPLQTVETMTSPFIKDLQQKGYVVCGLTARERKIWYDMPQEGVDVMTTKQLNFVGVDFDNKALEAQYPYLSWDSEYYAGTFFADSESKGKYLEKLLGNVPELPSKIVFIDDKMSQVQSVSKALVQLNIEHECYSYSAIEEKGKKFNPLIANIQLYILYESKGKTVISDEQAANLAKEHPDRDAEYYLRASLEIAHLY